MIPAIALVVGARPNFMKAAPILRGLSRHAHVRPLLIHTGQHYDAAMSDRFFTDLALPPPDVSLGIGGGGHAEQTARLLVALDDTLATHRPALVVVVGDVNSTLAGALAATQRRIPVAHVEAGLRSGDRRMPEEVNRVVTDALAQRLYTPTRSAGDTLRAEGHAEDAIRFVGNVMIDSLIAVQSRIEEAAVTPEILDAATDGFVLTLHRPANVDDADTLLSLLHTIADAAGGRRIVFPAHPRTRAVLERAPGARPAAVLLCEPLAYTAFLRVLRRARAAITDSGGVQEETTHLGIRCLTLRDTTERPMTVTAGTNILVGTESRAIDAAVRAAAGTASAPSPAAIELWDGHAGERLADDLASWACTRAS